MSELTHIRPDGLANNPAYTQVVTAHGSRTVYISGQVSLDAEGNTVGAGNLGAQTAKVMANLEIALEAAGATFDDVAKITTYVVNYQPSDRAVIAAARAPYFTPGSPPASTLVGVAALAAPDWLIEIEAIAVLN